MNPVEVDDLVRQLASGSQPDADDAWAQLKTLGVSVVPRLLAAYPDTPRAKGRVALVFHCIRYARVSDEAFELGLMAANDRARLVRYRGCGLLAYSLRPAALAPLQKLLSHPDPKTVEDARAAIAAIQQRDHHLFVDRDRTGRTFWVVNPEDEPNRAQKDSPVQSRGWRIKRRP